MRAEIIAVGTELLLGQIVNSNAQFLSRQCAGIGVDVYFQTVVGDNAGRIRDALELAKSRADLIICTGGLGPTQDDLTKEVLAVYLTRKQHIQEEAMNKIRSLFEARGAEMVESNIKQAIVLEGSDPLPNETGLAVGVALTQNGTHYMLLPGPPKEMKPMFEKHGIPWIRKRMTDETPLYSRMLKFAGIGESNLEHALLDLIEGQQDPTIAPYAKEGEVTIRLTTRAASEQEAWAKIKPAQQEIEKRVGRHLYAEEDIPIEQAVFRILRSRERTLSAAESCTGGLFSDMFTDIPESSTVFKGSIVSYTNEVKHNVLKVPLELLEGEHAPGAVSEETAAAMAAGAMEATGSDYAAAITGVAGPGPSEGKPVGLVFLGIAERNKPAKVIRIQASGNRESIKWRAAKAAYYHLWLTLTEAPNP
ncbi:competence/damage-inducible protein A [Paenibacillus aurantius]|uniref:Putative competence-damage inducible protein n=1 Tax=Paenibacillus aurantius TaxID=2918900 RepID=A0AA96RJZ2_9BACL|nr:competence/damage-inducible protein A [Paenibacillus aurantius]WNQ13799.1 competence/damage-inducible protein A [Paenibacillus aurantius]